MDIGIIARNGGLTLEQHFEKLKEYLNMDTEIPFEEFEAYYKDVIGYLQKNYEPMDHASLIKARYITSIVAANASDRASRKLPQFKKYRKMAEKCEFWSESIKYRLLKEGLTEEQIDEAEQKLSEAI
jgi:hypothetical protein